VDLSAHHRFVRAMVGHNYAGRWAGELDFEEGEILFVNEDWGVEAFATSLRSQWKCILRKEFYEVYEPEFLQRLMKAVASLVENLEASFVIQNEFHGDLQPVDEIVAGVRFLLVSICSTLFLLFFSAEVNQRTGKYQLPYKGHRNTFPSCRPKKDSQRAALCSV
jgi:hypothetical protein